MTTFLLLTLEFFSSLWFSNGILPGIIEAAQAHDNDRRIVAVTELNGISAVSVEKFSDNNNTIIRESKKNNIGMGNLLVLDELFDNDPGLLEKGTTTLSDLLVLDYLFNDGQLFGNNNNFGLNDLFAIDRLFGNNGGLLDSDQTTIKDLIILEQLFNGR